MNFISDACFLVLLLPAVSTAISAGSVLSSPTASCHTQEGFFLSIEWSDRFCDAFTAGILNCCHVDS